MRVTTTVPTLPPSSAALGSVAVSVTAGSSATVTVAVAPSADRMTVSAASTASLKIGVTVTVAVVWPAGIRRTKKLGNGPWLIDGLEIV